MYEWGSDWLQHCHIVNLDPGTDKYSTSLESSYVTLIGAHKAGKGVLGLSVGTAISVKKEANWFYQKSAVGTKMYITGSPDDFVDMNLVNGLTRSSVTVDIDKYNEWWDNGGIDGVIDWNKDVENFESYTYKEYDSPPKKLTCNTTINPTTNPVYRTVHDPYYWLQTNVGTKNIWEIIPAQDANKILQHYIKETIPAYIWNSFISTENYRFGAYGYKQLRMFIPPGTWRSNIEITNSQTGSINGGVMMQSWSRFASLPEVPISPPILPESGKVSSPNPDNIQNTFYSWGETITIFKDKDFQDTFNVIDKGGWLYIYIVTTETKNIAIKFSVDVRIDTFNSWWTTCGGTNADKSINWDHDVENKITYLIPVQG